MKQGAKLGALGTPTGKSADPTLRTARSKRISFLWPGWVHPSTTAHEVVAMFSSATRTELCARAPSMIRSAQGAPGAQVFICERHSGLVLSARTEIVVGAPGPRRSTMAAAATTTTAISFMTPEFVRCWLRPTMRRRIWPLADLGDPI